VQTNKGESELILWKVNPVGPLCKSGGVRELSRMTYKNAAVFKCISWIPTIIPRFGFQRLLKFLFLFSSGLGSVCNSPSSCFITTKDGHLSIYQAIVDARMLLNELFTGNSQQKHTSSVSTISENEDDTEPETKTTNAVNLKEMFNMCSTQSTGKPGCIIHLAKLADSNLVSQLKNIVFALE
jgi:hypothetical protein